MPQKFLLSLAFACALTAAAAFAIPWGAGVEPTIRQSDPILKDWARPFYVVRVVNSSEPGTIGIPPSSVVQFEKTLRGPAIAGERQVIWTHLISATTDANPACLTGPYDPKRECKTILHQESLEKTVRAPSAGDTLIIAAHTPEEILLRARHPGAIPGIAERIAKNAAVASFGGYPATNENLAVFDQYATYAERWTRTHMGKLFAAILLLTIATVACAVAAPRAGIAVAIVTIGTFFLYQDGFEVQENIRVDLIIIYPAIIATLVALTISVIRAAKQQSHKASISSEPE
jgi:hypothetical protein